MKKYAIILTAAALMTTASHSDEPMALPIQRLQMDVATKIAQTAIADCRKKGLSIGVTIVDRGGHPQVVMRDTLAMPITVPISRQKAYAAMNFNVPTSELENRFSSPSSVGKLDGIILSAGGLPINAASTILGGIGVSGAPSGETDEACAQAGLDAISTDLEMELQ